MCGKEVGEERLFIGGWGWRFVLKEQPGDILSGIPMQCPVHLWKRVPNAEGKSTTSCVIDVTVSSPYQDSRICLLFLFRV